MITDREGLESDDKPCVFGRKRKLGQEVSKTRIKNRLHYYLPKSKKLRKKYHFECKYIFPWKNYVRYARSRCSDRKGRYFKRGIKCFLSFEEGKMLWFRDKAYLLKKPSIDRIDNNGNYEFNNCRFIEFSDNCKQGALYGEPPNKKRVKQYNGNIFISEYPSAMEAGRKTGIDFTSILAVANKYYGHKTAGGYIWKFSI